MFFFKVYYVGYLMKKKLLKLSVIIIIILMLFLVVVVVYWFFFVRVCNRFCVCVCVVLNYFKYTVYICNKKKNKNFFFISVVIVPQLWSRVSYSHIRQAKLQFQSNNKLNRVKQKLTQRENQFTRLHIYSI